MFSRPFWTGTLERAVKTFAQSLTAILTGTGAGLFHVDWVTALDASLAATLLSALTSLATTTTVVATSPSLSSVFPLSPIPPQPGPPAGG